MGITDRLRKAWNVFRAEEASPPDHYSMGTVSYSGASPSRPRRTFSNEKSIVTSIYNRIAIDVASIDFRHVEVDENDRYLSEVNSHLSECLRFEPNLDQAPRAFKQDVVMTLFDRGAAAIVPVDTTLNPLTNETVDIFTMRVGEIMQFYPKHVRVSLWNEAKGVREEVTVEKRFCAIIENPLYSVMNEPNSTLQRLIRKLSLLDVIDDQSASGKLDLIIQLPYTIKTEEKRRQAEQRKEDIEFQLRGSQYGIAYTDGTERITQLNRPAENNLLKQIEYLVPMVYGQLGITESVMNGTADEAAMLNYHARTIEPIADGIKEAIQRSFIGLARTKKNERIMYFRDPFKLVPLSQLAEIADKFNRNEVLSSNEIREIVGRRPAADPKADELRNSNMPHPDDFGAGVKDMEAAMNEVFNGLEADVEKMMGSIDDDTS